MKQGGCPDCQQTVGVRIASPTELSRSVKAKGCQDSEAYTREFGRASLYVCVDHRAFGRHCRGSGEMPLAVTK